MTAKANSLIKPMPQSPQAIGASAHLGHYFYIFEHDDHKTTNPNPTQRRPQNPVASIDQSKSNQLHPSELNPAHIGSITPSPIKADIKRLHSTRQRTPWTIEISFAHANPKALQNTRPTTPSTTNTSSGTNGACTCKQASNTTKTSHSPTSTSRRASMFAHANPANRSNIPSNASRHAHQRVFIYKPLIPCTLGDNMHTKRLTTDWGFAHANTATANPSPDEHTRTTRPGLGGTEPCAPKHQDSPNQSNIHPTQDPPSNDINNEITTPNFGFTHASTRMRLQPLNRNGTVTDAPPRLTTTTEFARTKTRPTRLPATPSARTHKHYAWQQLGDHFNQDTHTKDSSPHNTPRREMHTQLTATHWEFAHANIKPAIQPISEQTRTTRPEPRHLKPSALKHKSPDNQPNQLLTHTPSRCGTHSEITELNPRFAHANTGMHHEFVNENKKAPTALLCFTATTVFACANTRPAMLTVLQGVCTCKHLARQRLVGLLNPLFDVEVSKFCNHVYQEGRWRSELATQVPQGGCRDSQPRQRVFFSGETIDLPRTTRRSSYGDGSLNPIQPMKAIDMS